MTLEIKFDPWDWLGVHCGGYFAEIDCDIIATLELLKEGLTGEDWLTAFNAPPQHIELICTLLCNTDAFAFDDDPTQLRFVGDDRFQTLDQLIEAWGTWYGEHYS